MAGSLASTIQGEAGSNPANQFAVASTIYNRMQAGTFPGGTDPYAIVNAPSQFVGSATPNATAQQFADAISNGTLPQYGNVGNATFFQTTGSNTTLGSVGYDIGGNAFSDQWGAPSSGFQPPQYGASGGNGNGSATSSGIGLDPNALANPSAVTDPTTGAVIPGASGNPITQASAALSQIGAFGANWIVRGAVIAGGIILIAAAAFALSKETA